MSDTEVMKELMLQLNDENVAALYYLRVPYEDWFFLTLYGENKLYLELQEIAYDDEGYQRVKTLHDLLAKQCEIARDCWKVVDDNLSARAQAVGDKIIGRNSQALRTQSSPIGEDCKTTSFNLRVAHACLLTSEDKFSSDRVDYAELEKQFDEPEDREAELGNFNLRVAHACLLTSEDKFSSDRVDYAELEKQFDELEDREAELGNSFYERLQPNAALAAAKCTAERASLGTAKNPEIYLNGWNAEHVQAYLRKFPANVYGYAQFLRFLAPFSGFLRECRDDLLKQEARPLTLAEPEQEKPPVSKETALKLLGVFKG